MNKMKPSRKTHSQTGFTLVELIMVIVILGVLSAFALPRFANLSTDAAKAALKGAKASIESASGIAHAACIASSACTEATATYADFSIEGEAIDFVYGYPAAGTGTTDGAAAANWNDSIVVMAGISCTDGATVGDFTCTLTGTTTPRSIAITRTDLPNCSITYTEPSGANTRPLIVLDETC